MDPKSAHKSYHAGHKNFIPEDKILKYGFLFVVPGLLLISVLYLVFYQTQLLYRPQTSTPVYPTPYPTITTEAIQNIDTSTWQTYKNTLIGYSMKYPNDFELPILVAGGGYATGRETEAQIYFAPKNYDERQYSLRILLWNKSLEQFIDDMKKGIVQTDNIRLFNPHPKIEILDTIYIDNLKIVVVNASGNREAYWLYKDYLFMFTNTILYKNNQEFMQILSTFKFTD